MYISQIAYVQIRDMYISEISFRDIMNLIRDITNWIPDLICSRNQFVIYTYQEFKLHISRIQD